jgi:hypothetical protein
MYRISLKDLKKLCEDTYFSCNKSKYGWTINAPDGKYLCTCSTYKEAYAFIVGFICCQNLIKEEK